jgi:hypothetical protein
VLQVYRKWPGLIERSRDSRQFAASSGSLAPSLDAVVTRCLAKAPEERRGRCRRAGSGGAASGVGVISAEAAPGLDGGDRPRRSCSHSSGRSVFDAPAGAIPEINDDLLGPGNQLILFDFYPDSSGNGQWPEAAPPFSSGGMLLGTHNGGIHHHILKIGIRR